MKLWWWRIIPEKSLIWWLQKQMFFKIGVLKNFAILPGKHLCWSLFLIKLQAWVIWLICKIKSFPVSLGLFYQNSIETSLTFSSNKNYNISHYFQVKYCWKLYRFFSKKKIVKPEICKRCNWTRVFICTAVPLMLTITTSWI